MATEGLENEFQFREPPDVSLSILPRAHDFPLA
jgi:hypothetical protein